MRYVAISLAGDPDRARRRRALRRLKPAKPEKALIALTPAQTRRAIASCPPPPVDGSAVARAENCRGSPPDGRRLARAR